MNRMFQTLESVVNKTSIEQFQAFLARYSDVTKWVLCSDYCLCDTGKRRRLKYSAGCPTGIISQAGKKESIRICIGSSRKALQLNIFHRKKRIPARRSC